MDHEVNRTYITIDGYVYLERYKYGFFIVMLFVYVLIVSFDMIILYLIWFHKNLHEPMYIFIAAFILNSLIHNTSMYPKILSALLAEKQIVSYSGCLFQFFLLYFVSGSDFLMLLAMSYDRYVAICKPLQHPTIMSRSTVSIFLALGWLVPAFVAAVPVILSADMRLCNFTLNGIMCNNEMYNLYCTDSKARTIFGLVGLLIVVLLPVLIILFTYIKIIVISYRSCREVKQKAAQTCLPHLFVLINGTFVCAYDVIIIRVESYIPKDVRVMIIFQSFLYQPLFNPLVYGLKMKEIYKHLKALFCQSKVM